MSNNRLFWYQIENIDKMLNKLMNIDFSNLLEVKKLRNRLVEEVSKNIDYYLEMHAGLEEFHDCKEYESRSRFGRKLLTIVDATIMELENDE